MSAEDVQLALEIFGDATRDAVLDMAEAIADDELWARNEERIAPDVKVAFVTPLSGGVEIMPQDFVGIAGIREGWRAWLEPWDRYEIEIGEVIDAGEGRVLLLVSTTAHMREPAVEVPDAAAALIRVKGGLIVEVRFFLDQAQARSEAGLD